MLTSGALESECQRRAGSACTQGIEILPRSPSARNADPLADPLPAGIRADRLPPVIDAPQREDPVSIVDRLLEPSKGFVKAAEAHQHGTYKARWHELRLPATKEFVEQRIRLSDVAAPRAKDGEFGHWP